MVHRGMTFDSGEWDYLPREKQWCWRIPIEVSLFATATDYLR